MRILITLTYLFNYQLKMLVLRNSIKESQSLAFQKEKRKRTHISHTYLMYEILTFSSWSMRLARNQRIFENLSFILFNKII